MKPPVPRSAAQPLIVHELPAESVPAGRGMDGQIVTPSATSQGGPRRGGRGLMKSVQP
jgi:hypothetical protein